MKSRRKKRLARIRERERVRGVEKNKRSYMSGKKRRGS
jgi:hypothetical protein